MSNKRKIKYKKTEQNVDTSKQAAKKPKTKSKAKKVSTSKEKPKISVWRTLFRSTFNNTAAIAGGRYLGWWLSAILAFLAVIIAIIPIMVQAGRVNGDDVLQTNQYGFDTGLLAFSEALNENDVELEVRVGENLSGDTIYYLDNPSKNFDTVFSNYVTLTIDSTGADRNFHYYSFKNIDGQEELKVFYIDDEITSDDPSTEDLDESMLGYAQVYKYLYEISYNNTVEGDYGKVPTNYLLFGAKNFFGAIYPPLSAYDAGGEIIIQGSSPSGTVAGNYTDKLLGLKLHEFNELIFVPPGSDESPVSIAGKGGSAETREAYVNGVNENWTYLFNEGYRPLKVQTFWTNFLIAAGTNFAIIILMGLVIFIITRGKHSPNRDWTLWESMKVAGWAAFSPGILAMIIGFIISSFAGMGFILFYGMRIMWMSMKQLRPAYE